jgi:hypothetical protein
MSYGYEITEEKPIWYVIEKELRGYINIPCTDHIKFGINEEETVLVNEPYNVHMKEIKELIKFCEIRGLEFTIWGDSIHYPGNTFGICIYCKDDYKNKGHQFWIDKIKSILEKEEMNECNNKIIHANNDIIQIYKEK